MNLIGVWIAAHVVFEAFEAFEAFDGVLEAKLATVESADATTDRVW